MAVGDLKIHPEDGRTVVVTHDGWQYADQQPLSKPQDFIAGLSTGALQMGLDVTAGSIELAEFMGSAITPDVNLGSDFVSDLSDRVGERNTQLVAGIRNPKTNLAGQFMGGLAGPARMLPQLLQVGLETLGRTDDSTDAALEGGLGAVGVIAGNRVGRMMQRRGSNVLQRNSRARDEVVRGEAFARLESRGFPMSRGDAAPMGRMGGMARQADIAQTTRTGEQFVNELGKRRKLNETVLAPLGKSQNTVDDAVRAAIDDDINKLYGGIRDGVPNQPDVGEFQALDDWGSDFLDQFSLKTGRPAKTFDRLQSDILNDQIDGKKYLQWRRELGKSGRNAAKQDVYEADFYYGLINQLDQVYEGIAGVGNELGRANQLWRANEVLNTSGVISPQGNVNAQSYIRNMDRFFGGVRAGKAPAELVESYRTVRAAQQFPGFQDSGTARRASGGRSSFLNDLGDQFIDAELGALLGGNLGRQLTARIGDDPLTDLRKTEVEDDETSDE